VNGFCVTCGCIPKPDEWAYGGADYCYDCGPTHICTTCKGNGYLIQHNVYKSQCWVCDSQGEVHA